MCPALRPENYSTTVGSVEIGQETELAMKHIVCASWCNEIAFPLSDPAATLTVGCGTTLVKRPLPSKHPDCPLFVDLPDVLAPSPSGNLLRILREQSGLPKGRTVLCQPSRRQAAIGSRGHLTAMGQTRHSHADEDRSFSVIRPDATRFRLPTPVSKRATKARRGRLRAAAASR